MLVLLMMTGRFNKDNATSTGRARLRKGLNATYGVQRAVLLMVKSVFNLVPTDFALKNGLPIFLRKSPWDEVGRSLDLRLPPSLSLRSLG